MQNLLRHDRHGRAWMQKVRGFGRHTIYSILRMQQIRASRSNTNKAVESLQKQAQADDLRLKARKLELESQSLSQNLSGEDLQRGRELVLGVKAKLEHKKAAYEWLQESSKRTQVEARELLANGTMPGFERLKVMISQSSFSKFCGKMDRG